MPFDPTLPKAGTKMRSGEIRANFIALNDKIDAIPAGPQGPQGIQGDPGPMGPPGMNGSDGAPGAQGPQGNDGAQGPQGPSGADGAPGAQGPQGPQGPPFAQSTVDGVTTLNPGDPATVSTSFDGTNVHFAFGVPRGNDGIQGPQGNDGAQGPQGADGPQGPAGEVSNAALAAAIAGTSNNTNAIPTLDTPFADPDAEALRQAYNALVLAMRR